MRAPDLDAEAKARRAMRQLLADLRLLGYTNDELRGRSVTVLLRMRERGFRSLMEAAPENPHAA